jgi:hypothetical protein
MRSFCVLVLFSVASFLPMQLCSQMLLSTETFDSLSGVFPEGLSVDPAVPGTWSVSSSLPSGGYSGASGASNCVASNSGSAGTVSLVLRKNLSTINFTGVTVIWSARKTASFTNPVTCEWSIDGIAWNILTFTDVAGNSSWALVNGGIPVPLPVAADGYPNLSLRWSYNQGGGSGTYRIDDIIVRGTPGPLRDGDGTAAIVNSTPGRLNGGQVVPVPATDLSVVINVSGTSSGLLDQVRISVPSAFPGLVQGGISLGGAFAGKIYTLSGRDILITGAALGTVPGTVSIAGLSSSVHAGSLSDGCDTFSVATAAAGGTLAVIVHPPRLWTVIPVSNIRSGGADSYGNRTMAHDTTSLTGRMAAVEGVVTVANGIAADTGATWFVLQDSAGSGILVSQPMSATFRSIHSGDRVTVLGTLGNQFGTTMLVPRMMASPDLIDWGSAVSPLPTVLPGIGGIGEENEGRLVSFPVVDWVSPGQRFDTVNAGLNRFIVAGDTGSIFVSKSGSLYHLQIPGESALTGVVLQRTDCAAGAPSRYVVLPRDWADLGGRPADGSGTALADPAAALAGSISFTQKITFAATGPDTIAGIRVTLPASWSWTGHAGDIGLTGTGMAGASVVVGGSGTSTDPYTVTIAGASVAAGRSGTLAIGACTLPGSSGNSLFHVATRGSGGILAEIAASPSVNIVTNPFEPARSGLWSESSTWTGGTVPSEADNVSISTPYLTVTIDNAAAVCRDCSITGSGSAPESGPVLRYSSAGSPSLTVHGKFSISGGTGGGGGDRGGRPWFTSSGNSSARCVLFKSTSIACSNTPSNGNAGFNMNEGTVVLAGSTQDTLSYSSAFRMGNLEVGDGSGGKKILCKPSANATIFIRSLTIRQNATLFIGSATNSYASAIGDASADTLPHLQGGIRVDVGGALGVLKYPGHLTAAAITCDGGDIRNDGLIDLGDSSSYTLAIGSGGGAVPASHRIYGTGATKLAACTVASAETLAVEMPVTIGNRFTAALGGVLREMAGGKITGTVLASRSPAGTKPEDFGGIGLVVSTDTAMGNCTATRVTGSAAVVAVGGHTSIARRYALTAARNSSLHALVTYSYSRDELNGQQEQTLRLWKSDDGYYWTGQEAILDTAAKTLVAENVPSVRFLTAADTANPLSSSSRPYLVNAGWNLASLPLQVPNPFRGAVYPGAISRCFAYSNGYVPVDTLACGCGFWLKFASRETITVYGTEVTAETLRLREGWQMIGAISRPVAWKDAGVSPAGIIKSRLFGYRTSYQISDTLFPGQGYWIRSGGEGTLVVDGAGSVEGSMLTGSAASGGSGTGLMDAPPAPPDGVCGAPVGSSAEGRFGITVAGPNPFNPRTVFRVTVPGAGRVRVEVVDLLGRIVRVLHDGVEDAGASLYVWDGTNEHGEPAAGGMYIVRAICSGSVSVVKVVMVR